MKDRGCPPAWNAGAGLQPEKVEKIHTLGESLRIVHKSLTHRSSADTLRSSAEGWVLSARGSSRSTQLAAQVPDAALGLAGGAPPRDDL